MKKKTQKYKYNNSAVIIVIEKTSSVRRLENICCRKPPMKFNGWSNISDQKVIHARISKKRKKSTRLLTIIPFGTLRKIHGTTVFFLLLKFKKTKKYIIHGKHPTHEIPIVQYQK